MLGYISEYSVEDAIEKYNNTPGNKKIEHVAMLPVQDGVQVRIAVVIIYSTLPDVSIDTSPTANKKASTRFIGQKPVEE